MEEQNLKLLCVPPAAASGMMYLKWQKYFEKEIEVCPIELPGRGTRFREEIPDSIDKITEDLIGDIEKKIGKNKYILFGFCSGAIITFDIYQKIKKYKLPEPEYVILASSRTPDMQRKTKSIMEGSEDMILQGLKYIFGFKVGKEETPGALFKEYVSSINPGTKEEIQEEKDEEILKNINEEPLAYKKIVSLMKTDSNILHRYEVKEPVYKFDSPLILLKGKYDNVIKEREIDAWKDYCNKDFQVKDITGGHMAVFDNYQETIERIKEVIL